jgi:hypothetical protein
MIENRYNKIVSTQRMSDITGTQKEQYVTYLTLINCLIQPFQQSFGEDIDGSVGKDYTMFCEVVDIKEGDKVVDGSNTYKVVGVNHYQDSLSNDHMEVIIREYKQ